jgi:hypothetical protein
MSFRTQEMEQKLEQKLSPKFHSAEPKIPFRTEAFTGGRLGE